MHHSPFNLYDFTHFRIWLMSQVEIWKITFFKPSVIRIWTLNAKSLFDGLLRLYLKRILILYGCDINDFFIRMIVHLRRIDENLGKSIDYDFYAVDAAHKPNIITNCVICVWRLLWRTFPNDYVLGNGGAGAMSTAHSTQFIHYCAFWDGSRWLLLLYTRCVYTEIPIKMSNGEWLVVRLYHCGTVGKKSRAPGCGTIGA